MLEKMGEFFDNCLEIYDEQQLMAVESAREFYPFTAAQLPAFTGAAVLDLDCGIGLKLEEYFAKSPTAKVTGIDLAPGMLAALRDKFAAHDITLKLGSYFELPLGGPYDAAVSVESLHHFTAEEKTGLYSRLHAALHGVGYFILTDYFAPGDAEEREYRADYLRLHAEQGIADSEFYHFTGLKASAIEEEAKNCRYIKGYRPLTYLLFCIVM